MERQVVLEEAGKANPKGGPAPAGGWGGGRSIPEPRPHPSGGLQCVRAGSTGLLAALEEK